MARGKICSIGGSLWTVTENRSSANGTLENFIHFEVIDFEIDRFYFSISPFRLHSQQSTILIDNAHLIDFLFSFFAFLALPPPSLSLFLFLPFIAIFRNLSFNKSLFVDAACYCKDWFHLPLISHWANWNNQRSQHYCLKELYAYFISILLFP